MDTTTAPSAEGAAEDLSVAPSTKLSATEWLRENLFSTWANSIVSAALIAVGLFVTIKMATWVIDADWEIVRTGLTLAMVGQFPRDELWRIWGSLFFLAAAVGFGSGVMARTTLENTLAKGLPAEREPMRSLARRFWPVIALVFFFVSFARTLPPYLAAVGTILLLVVTRELGWRAAAAIRERGMFLSVALIFASLIVIAGTSTLGGIAFGLLAAAWAAAEIGRRDIPAGASGTAIRVLVPVAAGLVFFGIEKAIPLDGFGWDRWGGLHVSLFVTVVGIGMGLPFGILLAMGRRSQLPAIRIVSTVFIEFVRGVPLISLLFFSSVFLRLFFPLGQEIPADLTLAMMLVTAFSAAYIAEIVRGGLQAVPQGQTEGGQAIGLSAGKVQRLIVLPQALRAVIPAMVGQFISLFKDTSLLSIIGILEFLRFTDVINNQPQFLGKELSINTYVYVAIGYWAIAYTMSKESRRLETKLGVGVR